MIWYRVQVGAYALKKSAEKVSVDLIEKGFKTVIAKEGLLYKVRIGSFNDRAKAEKLLARVKKYKKYEKSKIFEWNDGKDLPVIKPTDDEKKEKEPDYRPIIDLHVIWLSETHESMFGDAQCFIEYAADGTTIAHAILIDTGQDGCDTVKKLKKLGVNVLDAVVLSHAHGDHYGYLSTILDKFEVKHLYLPSIASMKKYQPSYAKAIQRQETKATKKKIPVTYLGGAPEYPNGTFFEVGHIKCQCIYQVPMDNLSEKDGHHGINNNSICLMFTLDGIGRVLMCGDLSNEGKNYIMDNAVRGHLIGPESFEADICKIDWHADDRALRQAWVKYVGAVSWYWNYHHSTSNGGRKTTWKKLIAAGIKEKLIYRNYEDGDIRYRYHCGEYTVTASKRKTFEKFKSRFIS